MLKEAAGGTPIVLFCGLNRRTPQEGAGFISPPGVVTVTFSLDPLSKQVVQDVLDRKILHLSGSWMDPTLMGRIPAILWAILFDANAVQYLNRLALQLLTSKLAPGGYLFLPIINLYSAGGQVRDSRFQFAYEQKDGPWDGICYSPPDSLCDVLREELRSEQLTLTIRMVRRDPPEPQNEACAKFLQTRCQGCGIRFVHHRQKAASIAFMLEFRTFSGEYCTFAKAGAPTKEGEGAPTRTRAGIPIRKDILQFYENPVAVIHRKSLED
jgi:hypothetical protein